VWNKRTEGRVLVGRLKGRRQFGRPRRRWDDNIKEDLQEVGWGGVDRFDLVEDRSR
jgi:hypothetical protein